MNKIVLNYIQEELGTEPKPVWTEIDEAAFDDYLSDIDLRSFPHVSYGELKEVAFANLYRLAEEEILQSAFNLIDGVVEKFERGGIIKYQQGDTVTNPRNQQVKAKTLSGQEMLNLISTQSTGNSRKDRKGYKAIEQMIRENPNLQFTVYENGQIDISGLSDWNQGAGTGKNFSNRPSIFKRIMRGGENKAQRLYEALASSIASGRTDLFKEEVTPEPVNTNTTPQPEPSNPENPNNPENPSTETPSAQTPTQEPPPQTDKPKDSEEKKERKGKVESPEQKKKRLEAEEKFNKLSEEQKKAVVALALQKRRAGDPNYWVNAINEYINTLQNTGITPNNDQQSGGQNEQQESQSSETPVDAEEESLMAEYGTIGGIVTAILSLLGLGIKYRKPIMGMVKTLMDKGLNGRAIVETVVKRFAPFAKEVNDNMPKLQQMQSRYSQLSKMNQRVGTPSTRVIKPKKNQSAASPSPQSIDPKTQSRIDNLLKSMNIKARHNNKYEQSAKSIMDNYERLKKEGKSGEEIFRELKSMYEAAGFNKFKKGGLLPKSKTKFLQLGGVLSLSKKVVPKTAKEEGKKSAVKSALKEFGSDALIGLGSALTGDSQKAKSTTFNNILDIASLFPVIGPGAQMVNSASKLYNEYKEGDLDWKDFAREGTDLALSFVPGGKAVKTGVVATKLAKKPSIIKKLIS